MEDVQYLLQQGTRVEQSFLFVVDSAMRDTNAYPTPSDYYISFPMPFRNVFALDLVDATIPRTEYSIEADTNTLCYAPGVNWSNYETARLAAETVTVTLQPGDYNVAQLIEALNSALATAASNKNHVPVRVEAVGDPVDITNKIKFTRPEPFTIFVGNSSIRYAIGFGNPATAPGGTVAWDSTPRYATDASVSNDMFQSVDATVTAPTPAFAGPVPVELVEYSLDLNATESKLRQTFTCATSGMLSNAVIKGTTSASAANALTASVYSGATLIESAQVSVVAGAASWNATFSGESTLLAGQVYKLVLQYNAIPTPPTIRVYRAETFSDDDANLVETYANGSYTEYSGLDALCLDLNVQITGYKVEAPGQCDLTGERYVLVRSPDIEQHLHRDLASAFDRMAPGLGMMKLGGLGYREERFNFLAYQTRKFHPIGKLKGIRIRLETRAGKLYDSHGINHTLLLCVKMYAMGPSQAIPRDLFPGYTPDSRQALVSKLERERC
jgi:hypothetical protein